MNKKIFQQEIEDWNKNVQFYVNENLMPFQEEIIRKKIYDFYQIKESDQVLEAGGGVIKLGKNAVLVDFSPEMIKEAKKINPANQCFEASIHQLPFPDQSFDVIVANGLIHHIKVQGILDESLKEFRRVLKNGGKLCIFDRAPNLIPKIFFYLRQPAKLFYKPKSTCGTRNEMPFLEIDVKKIIDSGFVLKKRMYLINVFFQAMIILTNIFQYIFGPRISIKLQKNSLSLAKFIENVFSFKFLCAEQCLIMIKK